MKILQRRLPAGRLEARNGVQEEARARLFQEAAPAFNQMQRNAVFVHGTPIRYFSKLQHGLPCSCTVKDTVSVSADSATLPALSPTAEQAGKEFRFDFRDAMVGGAHESNVDGLFEDDVSTLQQPPAQDVNAFDPTSLLEDLFDTGIDCGICYRTRICGGFEEINASRQVFAHYHIKDVSGYTRDDTSSPTSMVSMNPDDCWVEFECEVPKYYKGIEYQVMNNTELLSAYSLHAADGSVLSLSHFAAAAGGKLRFRVVGVDTFTHVVIRFAMPVNQLVGDFPQDSRTLDYTMMDTISQGTVVVPNTIPRTASDDVLIKLNPNGAPNVWTVTDRNYYRLENGYNLGWTLTVRTVQADESLFKIWKARRVLD